jgi:hypothetical protein
MAGIPAELFQIITAVIMVSWWSQLYRGNFFYNAVEALALGTWSAAVTATNINTIVRIGIEPAAQGDIIAMLSIVGGILIYTFFTRKYIEGYRIVFAILQAANLAINVVSRTYRQYDALLTYAKPENFVIMICSVLLITMFIYNRRFARVLRVPQKLALLTAALPYYGYFAGSQLIECATPMTFFFLTFWDGLGIYVAIIAFVLVLVDIMYRRSKKVAVKA